MPKLSDIDLESVGLVDRPANSGAVVVLMKRADTVREENNMIDVEQIIKSNGRGFTRSAVAAVIDQEVRKMADRRGIDLATAYLTYLNTPEGGDLYSAHELARLDQAAVAKSEPEPDLSYQAIQTEVSRLMAADPALDEGGAIIKALSDTPLLYENYEANRCQRV